MYVIGGSLGMEVPDVKLPDIKSKLPDVKVPDFKAPTVFSIL